MVLLKFFRSGFLARLLYSRNIIHRNWYATTNVKMYVLPDKIRSDLLVEGKQGRKLQNSVSIDKVGMERWRQGIKIILG